jgi:hypothetical protein
MYLIIKVKGDFAGFLVHVPASGNRHHFARHSQKRLYDKANFDGSYPLSAAYKTPLLVACTILYFELQSNLVKRDVKVTTNQSRLEQNPSQPSCFVWR